MSDNLEILRPKTLNESSRYKKLEKSKNMYYISVYFILQNKFR